MLKKSPILRLMTLETRIAAVRVRVAPIAAVSVAAIAVVSVAAMAVVRVVVRVAEEA